MLDLSEVREDYEATGGTEEQERGMLKHHLIHLHVMQSSIMTAPAPHTQFGARSFLLRMYRRNRSSQCLAVTISLKSLISP